MGHGAETWRKIENSDHTFDISRMNLNTIMTHFFIETKECSRVVTLNREPKTKELMMTTSAKTEVILHVK